MATYYKYKERDLDKSMIDWSGLTKTISDNLLKEKADREKRKFELDQKAEEELNKLSNYEQGVDPTANVFAMKEAFQAKAFLMENHKLMKAGLRPINDSKLIQQRVGDTWSTLSNSLKTYNENFKRLRDLDGKGNEAVLKSMSDQLDLKNKKIYYDPNTGAGYYVSVDKNGEIDMNTALPVKALTNIQHQEFETIDVNAEAAKVAKNAAPWKTFLTSTTDIKTARLNDNYKDWINNTTKSGLNSDEKIASVLMDYLGIEYNLDGTPSKRSVSYQRVSGYGPTGELIMEDVKVDIGDVEMKFNPKSGKLEPQLTNEQKKYAEDAYKNAIEINVAREASKDYVPPRESDRKAGAAKKSKEDNFNVIIAALQGDEDKFKTIFDQLDQAKVNITGDQLSISGKDPINVSTSKTISQAGARIAAQLGYSPEEFVDFINKKGLQNSFVSEGVKKFSPYDTSKLESVVTSDNINLLNDSLFEVLAGSPFALEGSAKISSFKNALETIAGPKGVSVFVFDDGRVAVGDDPTPIKDGINNVTEVLKAIDSAQGSKPKGY
jgi:phosphopantetheinyl transferase (holo-ACP synthase)